MEALGIVLQVVGKLCQTELPVCTRGTAAVDGSSCKTSVKDSVFWRFWVILMVMFWMWEHSEG